MIRPACLLALLLALPAAAQTPPAGQGFAIRLYQALDGGTGNLALAPGSVAAAVALAGMGAEGATQAGMETALGVNGVAGLDALGAAPGGGVRAANALWVARDFTLKARYQAVAARDFGAKTAGLDFTDGTAAARIINGWVAAHTAGKITDLVSPATMSADTRLVLTNAVYFKGSWQVFDKSDTDQQRFHSAPGQDETVAMMHGTGDFVLAQTREAAVLALPYEGGQAELDVVLPRGEFGLAKLETGLSAAKLAGWLASAQAMPVDVSLPRFTVTGNFELSGALSGLGMGRAFDAGHAEFGGMAVLAPGRRLFISAVLHKAYVTVDETGTEAAAATSVQMTMATAAPPGLAVTPVAFVADHPFLFIIRALPSGEILFIGRVESVDG
ncbi:serpin family protein [Acidocella sp.]|uniref:serpin family protein n=1 Tax=Acidocella sp. TaxID=50710 RepID=UPI002609B4FB|nr:serpin family protein [Acidocella sp.]